MKKILIGRGAGNDIRIKDESDRVSRRQAVIEVSPTGKMRLHDTSSNGTFVNGKKVPKPGGVEVSRGDKVDFAHVMELDWALVKDPYKSMKIAVGVFAAVLIILAVLFFVFSDEIMEKLNPKPAETEQTDAQLDEEVVDTIIVDSVTGATTHKKVTKKRNRKAPSATPQKPEENKENNVTPDNKENVNKEPNGKGPNDPTKRTGPDPKKFRPENGPQYTEPNYKKDRRL